jgi:ABC-2 type transport system ATP-binding protein
MQILELEDVTKAYRDQVAVDHVTFNIAKGSIFGLLGPNGAGKTSLIRIITTITGADSGRILFDGEILSGHHPEQIGYLPEERGLYKKMKVGEQLLYFAQLKGLSLAESKKRIGDLLDKFEIKDWWDKKVEELSKGMQQKIQFIATIVHNPKLIILDEPFTGLDPINTNLIKAEIQDLNTNGTSVIFSTHRMEQVEEICEDIVLINQGKNVLEGKVSEIKEKFKENVFRIEFDGVLPADLNGHFTVVADGEKELLIKLDPGKNANDLLRELINRDFVIKSFQEVLPSLNEIFIKQVESITHE